MLTLEKEEKINWEEKVRSITNWPKEGVTFRDITPILGDNNIFHTLIDDLAKIYEGVKIDKIVGIDARGFIIGAALAYKLNKGLVIARKKGKLPYKTVSKEYALEYGTATLEIHEDSIKKGENILIVDDVLATGGTAEAVASLVKLLGGNLVGILFCIEIEVLEGRNKLNGERVEALLKY